MEIVVVFLLRPLSVECPFLPLKLPSLSQAKCTFGRAQNDDDQEARVDFGAVLELLKNDEEGEGGGDADKNEDTGNQFNWKYFGLNFIPTKH